MNDDLVFYPLELTDNSKAGPSFSLPRTETCIHATETCWKVCYGRSIRYQADASKQKRARNYHTVRLLLQTGGAPLLAPALVGLIDKACPADYEVARALRVRPKLPWTLRVHDVGDFFQNPEYPRAWALAAARRPECKLWFYTRSFMDNELLVELTKLAKLPNSQGWLSIDKDNWLRGLDVYRRFAGLWKLAILYTADFPSTALCEIREVASGDVISFPQHQGGRHISPLPEKIVHCPQVLGNFKLQPSSGELRPCQECKICLP